MRYTKLSIAFSFLLGFFLSSCTNDDNKELAGQTPVGIHFNASPYQLESKAIHTGNVMPTEQPIGIYGWGHKLGESTPLTMRFDLINQPYTTTDGTAYTSDLEAHFPIAADTVIDFYAYYPYQSQLSDLKASYDLKDQTDIMWATPILNKGKMDVQTSGDNSSATVALSFNHALSAITIIIKKADDIKEVLSLQAVELVGYNPSIQLDIKAGTVTASGTQADYVLPISPTTITPAGATLLSHYLLCPGMAPKFRFTISDHTYEVQPTQAFIAGKMQEYTFTIRAEDINVSASINPWTEGPGGSGEIGI